MQKTASLAAGAHCDSVQTTGKCNDDLDNCSTSNSAACSYNNSVNSLQEDINHTCHLSPASTVGDSISNEQSSSANCKVAQHGNKHSTIENHKGESRCSSSPMGHDMGRCSMQSICVSSSLASASGRTLEVDAVLDEICDELERSKSVKRM